VALVIAREVFVLALSRYGLRHGVDLKINWAGRLGVAPTMGAIFFALIGLHTVALVMLYLGLALSVLATVLYVRSGLQQVRSRKASSSA
jgi:cardiolipin synthase